MSLSAHKKSLLSIWAIIKVYNISKVCLNGLTNETLFRLAEQYIWYLNQLNDLVNFNSLNIMRWGQRIG